MYFMFKPTQASNCIHTFTKSQKNKTLKTSYPITPLEFEYCTTNYHSYFFTAQLSCT